MPVEIGRDISEFEVGMTRSYTRTFTADDIERFAAITGDHNYFHVDDEAARHSVFGRRIAQGLLVASMSTHMGGVVFPGPGYIAANLNVAFLKPVYAGDTVTVTIEITAVDRQRKWLEMDARWINQHGELVAEGTSSGRPTRVTYEPQPVRVRPVEESDCAWARPVLEEWWGSTDSVSRGVVHHVLDLPGFVAVQSDERIGLATYHLSGDACELVTLNSLVPGKGVGAALIDAVRGAAASAGCKRLWLVTTNDNLRALGFYQKRGFQLVAVHPEALDEARKLKPAIPRVGEDGIPLRDEIELEMALTG